MPRLMAYTTTAVQPNGIGPGNLQSPYMALPVGIPHSDATIRDCQVWLADHYATRNPVAAMVERSSLAPTTIGA